MLTGRIDELVVEGFGPAATDDSLGITLAELFTVMPLASPVGFAGDDPTEPQALIIRRPA